MKPTICLDFDGVFNNYRGYDGDNLGTPREGIKEFLIELNKNYTVIVLSARRYSHIIRWLDQHDLWQYVADVTSFKPPAIAYIDDRSICFDGDFKKCLKQIKSFRPYWQKEG